MSIVFVDNTSLWIRVGGGQPFVLLLTVILCVCVCFGNWPRQSRVNRPDLLALKRTRSVCRWVGVYVVVVLLVDCLRCVIGSRTTRDQCFAAPELDSQHSDSFLLSPSAVLSISQRLSTRAQSALLTL